jgi:3alpha(or 20beta)-hydroxysteroid dehydrogenase
VVIGDVLVAEGKALADELGEAVRFVELDVTDEASWANAVTATTSAFDRLDVLINNAGIWKIAPIAMMSGDDYMEVVRVNQLGVFLGMKAVLGAMGTGGGGSIVNISSVAGLTGAIGQVAYGATKWAVRGMTKTAAVELAMVNIRVNSIHPGLIDTQMLQMVRDFGVAPEDLLSTVPQSRFGTADEVAKVALFLASDESSHCTGGEYTVDGGMTAGFAPRG